MGWSFVLVLVLVVEKLDSAWNEEFCYFWLVAFLLQHHDGCFCSVEFGSLHTERFFPCVEPVD